MGVTYLLDTHVLLWLLGSARRVPDDVRGELSLGANRLVVSAASAMEVAAKARLGKLDVGRHLVPTWGSRLDAIAAEALDITTEHSLLAGVRRRSPAPTVRRLARRIS